eukprot:GFYU01017234.1.p1 GENE.GFYU01017234.1~~GFYU01017234.1.p1  ORF type:complete len:260 (+),score=41.17 GFYU01017234.1:57-836(+)
MSFQPNATDRNNARTKGAQPIASTSETKSMRAVPPPSSVLKGVTICTPDTDTSAASTVPGHNSTRSKNVSNAQWEKFQALKAKRQSQSQEIGKRADKIRRRAVRKAEQACTDGTEAAGDVTVEQELFTKAEKKRKRTEEYHRSAAAEQRQQRERDEKKFLQLYRNQHNPTATARGRYDAKTDAEKQIDKAVESGDLELASKLSDQIVKDEIATSLSQTAEAMEYIEKKEQEEEKKKAKKKSKPNWMFSAKERWEIKQGM